MVLGESFTKSTGESRLVTMRYNFRSVHADRSQPAVLTEDGRGPNAAVRIEWANSSAVGDAVIPFNGIACDAAPTECVLLFENGCFRLERMRRTVKNLHRAHATSGASTGMLPQARARAADQHILERQRKRKHAAAADVGSSSSTAAATSVPAQSGKRARALEKVRQFVARLPQAARSARKVTQAQQNAASSGGGT